MQTLAIGLSDRGVYSISSGLRYRYSNPLTLDGLQKITLMLSKLALVRIFPSFT